VQLCSEAIDLMRIAGAEGRAYRREHRWRRGVETRAMGWQFLAQLRSGTRSTATKPGKCACSISRRALSGRIAPGGGMTRNIRSGRISGSGYLKDATSGKSAADISAPPEIRRLWACRHLRPPCEGGVLNGKPPRSVLFSLSRLPGALSVRSHVGRTGSARTGGRCGLSI
jgi:hypothetical protein